MADAQAMGGVVKLVVKTFLEDSHYAQLFRQLSAHWSSCHSLTAAVRLMEAYGVKVTPEEEARFAKMDEGRMIDNLVMRMPQQSREQFEHFFLQLSFIASTTSRLRVAIEEGDLTTVEEAMESAESMGVLPYLMKMTVAQAGAQVSTAEGEQDKWLSETEAKVAPLLQSQAQAMVSQKALAQARAQIDGYHADAKQKSKGVLAKMTAGNEKALLGTALGAWHEIIRLDKMEREILAEYGYEDQIVRAEEKLFSMKKKQLEASKAVLNRANERAHAQRIDALFAIFKENTAEKKSNKAIAAEIKALEEKLSSTASNAKANAKKTMARVGAGNDDELKGLTFKAWVAFAVDYKKDLEMNNAIKLAEQKMHAFQDKQKAGSVSVLTRMTNADSNSLKKSVFEEWRKIVVETAEKDRMEKELSEAGGTLKSFASRNKGSAQGVHKRAAALLDVETFIFFFTFWKREVKVDLLRRAGERKVRDQKDSLVKVKGAVKGFAVDLESTLRQGTPPASTRQSTQ